MRSCWPAIKGSAATLFGPGLLVVCLLVNAGTAVGQAVPELSDLPDIPDIPDIPDTTGAHILSEEVPEPTAGALALDNVDLWSTGVSPTGAVLATPLFPGWGQLYTENFWKAGLAYGTEMYFWTNILNRDRQAVRARDFANTFPPDDPNYTRYNAIAEESWEQMRDFAWWSGGVLLIIMLDAYVGAHLFNFDRDPIPVPNRWEDTFGSVGEGVAFSDPGPTLMVFQWRKKF